ncbi:MAG TPA: class I SAM-dependent methyltransferase [Polyangiales bacterium]|nr:class I SAM-dependent methyltransferase [Polyangiales bacterium]
MYDAGIMGIGRRRVGLDEPERWVYNRMAEAYAARPAYPTALVARLSELAGPVPAHVLDLGAGIGHLSLPLAERGHRVTAVEPAHAMLEQLQRRGHPRIACTHATAEALPLPDACAALAIIADALHFLDAELTGNELARVLEPRGTLAIVQVELGTSPFMQALSELMRASAPRRPKRIDGALTQLATLAGVKLSLLETYELEQQLPLEQVERILGSISFIGPAMNPERFEAFCAGLRAIEHASVWHTTVRLWAGRRFASESHFSDAP